MPLSVFSKIRALSVREILSMWPRMGLLRHKARYGTLGNPQERSTLLALESDDAHQMRTFDCWYSVRSFIERQSNDFGKLDCSAGGGTVGSYRDLAKWMWGDASTTAASSGQALRPAKNADLRMIYFGCASLRSRACHGASFPFGNFRIRELFRVIQIPIHGTSHGVFLQEC